MSPLRRIAPSLLAACALAPAADAPVPPLRVTVAAEPESLDPALARSVSAVFVCRQLFEGLVELDPETLEPLPASASSWEVSDGGRTWRFRLGARRWSDGTPVTSADFARAWRRALDPRLAAPYAYLLFGIRGARAAYEGKGDPAAIEIEAPDPGTLVARLERPDPSFAALLSFPTFFPVPKGAEADAAWTEPGRIVSNGPYRLAARRRQRDLDLAESEGYGGARPAIPAARILVIEDLNTGVMMFRAGEADWVRDLPASQIPALRPLPGFSSAPYLGTYFYRVNVRRKPFDDPRVRRALGRSIDRDLLVKALLPGGEAPARSFVPPGLPPYDPPAGPAFDPEAARKDLADAGFPGGRGFPAFSILFSTSETHRRIAEAISGMWSKHLGVAADLKPMEAKAALEATQKGDYDVARSSWIADVPDPMNFLEIFESGSGNNRTGWASGPYDGLLASARDEADPARRAATLARAEAILLDGGPILPIHVYANQALVSPRIRGLAANPLNHQLLKRLRRE